MGVIWTGGVAILLQYSINDDVRGSAITFPTDNQLDRLMKQAKGVRKAGDRSLAFVTSLLAALMLLIGPDDLLRERRILMAKVAAAGGTPKPVPQDTTPPARDPNIAVEEEYQIARQRGTVPALELFIERHPDDPLAEKARANLRRMTR
jgi:hypothetical protein